MSDQAATPAAPQEGGFGETPQVDFAAALAEMPVVGAEAGDKPEESQQQPKEPAEAAPAKEDEPKEPEPQTPWEWAAEAQVKIGDQTYSHADFQEALTALNTRDQWQKSFTEKSQVDALLRGMSDQPEAAERFMAYALQHAYKRESLPDKVEPKALELPYRDEDDVEHSVKLEPGSEQWKQLKDYFFHLHTQENQGAFAELKHLREQEVTRKAEAEQMKREAANREMKQFITKHKLNFPEGDVLKNMETILQTMETNPYADTVRKILAAQADAEMFGGSLEDNFTRLFGAPDNAKAKEQLLKDKARQEGKKVSPSRSTEAAESEEELMAKALMGDYATALRASKAFGD